MDDVVREVGIVEQYPGQAMKHLVMRPEELFYVIFVRHTPIRHANRQKPNPKGKKFLQYF